MRQTADQLRAAKALIERGWCQFEDARDVRGNPLLDARSPKATQWCLSGALLASSVAKDGHHAAVTAIRHALGNDFCDYVSWNDLPTMTRDRVLDMLDRAIAAEEAAPCP